MDNCGIAKRLGRGKLRDSRSRSLGTKLTHSEEQEVSRVAEAEGKSASEWAREVLLREARRAKNDPVFTEVVGTRMLLNEILRALACGHAMDDKSFDELIEEVRMSKHETARQVMELYTIPSERGK